MNTENMELVWEEDFTNQKELNKLNWKTVIWEKGFVNNEEQYYVDNQKNCHIENGSLKIKAIKQSDGRWESARITTKGNHCWKYGYFEAEIKLPKGYSGIWPAFWMMPENSVYGNWPRSGELDILEYSPATFGSDVYGTIHYGTGNVDNQTHFYKNLMRTQLTDVSSQFHKYGMLWTENEICFYYDGIKSQRVWNRQNKTDVEWPYNQEFHIILNLAMGGTLGGKIPEDMTEAVMEIKNIRVFQ